MRGLPSALFYMITASLQVKIYRFFTANQFACSNLLKLLGFKNKRIIYAE
jgi:hypothetical protein